jgi:hypothetical protein
MAAGLRGTREFKARLRAVRKAFKPVGRAWADETVRLAKPQAPVRTGKGRRSIRRRNANQKRATVVAAWYMRFQDRGAKPHVIRPKSVSGSKRGGVGTARSLRFEAGGRTIFARKVNHPGIRARLFATRAAQAALRRSHLADVLIDEWNRAA